MRGGLLRFLTASPSHAKDQTRCSVTRDLASEEIQRKKVKNLKTRGFRSVSNS